MREMYGNPKPEIHRNLEPLRLLRRRPPGARRGPSPAGHAGPPPGPRRAGRRASRPGCEARPGQRRRQAADARHVRARGRRPHRPCERAAGGWHRARCWASRSRPRPPWARSCAASAGATSRQLDRVSRELQARACRLGRGTGARSVSKSEGSPGGRCRDHRHPWLSRPVVFVHQHSRSWRCLRGGREDRALWSCTAGGPGSLQWGQGRRLVERRRSLAPERAETGSRRAAGPNGPRCPCPSARPSPRRTRTLRWTDGHRLPRAVRHRGGPLACDPSSVGTSAPWIPSTPRRGGRRSATRGQVAAPHRCGGSSRAAPIGTTSGWSPSPSW